MWSGGPFGLFLSLILYPFVVLAAPEIPLSTAWQNYRQAVETSRPDDIITSARELQEAAKNAETLQVPELSLVMLRDADALRARDDTGAAIRIAQIAAELSPELVAPHVWLAQTWLGGPDPDVVASAKEWAAAWKTSMSDFWSLLYRIDRLIAAALFSVASVTVLLVAWFLIRSVPLFAHLLVEWSGHRVFRPTAWLAAAWILLLPLAAVRWGAWLVLAPAALVWWFLSVRERLALTVLAASGVAMSFLLPYVVPVLTVDHSDEFRLVVDVAEGRDAGGSMFDSVVVDSPEGAAARGTAMVRSGRLDEAATFFEEALVRWPDDPRLLTAYGNVLFHRREYDRAVQRYEQALQADPTSLPILYNLSQAYRAGLHFEEGEARYQQARALDAGLLDRYADRSRRGEAFLVADYPTTHQELLASAFEPRALPPVVDDAITHISRHVSRPAALAVLGLFVACWVLGRWFPNQPAASCAGCGTAVCRHCRRYFLDLKLCPSCWKAYAKGAKFTAQTTLPQVLRRWEVRRRVAAVLSLVPGLGHLSVGRPLWGLAFGFAGWGLLGIGLLREVGWTTTDLRLVPPPWYMTWAPIAGGLTILVLIGVRHLLNLDWPRSDSVLPQERG